MRLGDLDALKETYQKWIPQLSSKEDEGDKRGVETCIAVLDDAPTINPEDLRPKGKWIPVHEHMWRKKEDGEIDEWAWDSEFHNGPVCVLCGATPCIHCTPGYKDTECYEESYRCSECNHHSREKEKFCAGCGADMRDGAKMEG